MPLINHNIIRFEERINAGRLQHRAEQERRTKKQADANKKNLARLKRRRPGFTGLFGPEPDETIGGGRLFGA